MLCKLSLVSYSFKYDNFKHNSGRMLRKLALEHLVLICVVIFVQCMPMLLSITHFLSDSRPIHKLIGCQILAIIKFAGQLDLAGHVSIVYFCYCICSDISSDCCFLPGPGYLVPKQDQAFFVGGFYLSNMIYNCIFTTLNTSHKYC